MSNSTARDSQLAMAHCLRRPATAPPRQVSNSAGWISICNWSTTISKGFVSGGFLSCAACTVMRTGTSWCARFIDGHRCHTPYFLEISQEFIEFLMNEHRRRSATQRSWLSWRITSGGTLP